MSMTWGPTVPERMGNSKVWSPTVSLATGSVIKYTPCRPNARHIQDEKRQGRDSWSEAGSRWRSPIIPAMQQSGDHPPRAVKRQCGEGVCRRFAAGSAGLIVQSGERFRLADEDHHLEDAGRNRAAGQGRAERLGDLAKFQPLRLREGS